MNSSREYLLAAENIFFWYSLPLKNEWGMTTATRTLDLFCAALRPGTGLEKSVSMYKSTKYANHAKKKIKTFSFPNRFYK